PPSNIHTLSLHDALPIYGLAGVKEIAPNDVLEVDCDILCPSALENSITMANVGKVKAKIIAELANGPTTPASDRILEDNDVMVIDRKSTRLNSSHSQISY